jgi:hypothetical protein
LIEYVSMGIFVLMDRSERPLFPRWVGRFNLAVAAIFATGAPVNSITTGPFARNGLLAFWAVLVAFGGWVLVTFFCVLRDLGRPEPAVFPAGVARPRRAADASRRPGGRSP